VWEERGANTGIRMERWTDGKGWGPSKVRDVSGLLLLVGAGDDATNAVSLSGIPVLSPKESEMGEDPNASTPCAQMIRLALLNAATLPDFVF
jgi:hypothetical protein